MDHPVSGLLGLGRRDRLHLRKRTKLSRTFVVRNAAAVEGLRRYLEGELNWTTVK